MSDKDKEREFQSEMKLFEAIYCFNLNESLNVGITMSRFHLLRQTFMNQDQCLNN